MVKLQRIKRSNETYVFSVNIPLALIDELGWKKSDSLFLEVVVLDGEQQLRIRNMEDFR